jgi:hypothetical protein
MIIYHTEQHFKLKIFISGRLTPMFSGRIAEQSVANQSGGGQQGGSELKLLVGRNFHQLTRVLNHIAVNKRFRIISAYTDHP